MKNKEMKNKNMKNKNMSEPGENFEFTPLAGADLSGFAFEPAPVIKKVNKKHFINPCVPSSRNTLRSHCCQIRQKSDFKSELQAIG